MTSDSQSPPQSDRFKLLLPKLIPLLLVVIPVLYLVTMAQTVVFGDPTEYTFVANILGIAHPPGYPVITLLGKLFQTMIPFGEIPWRMHLLSIAAGVAAGLFVYGTVSSIARSHWAQTQSPYYLDKIIGLFAALIVATGVNFWQHAIHTNPHIITATFLAGNLFFLTKWWTIQRSSDPAEKQKGDRWLFIFSFSAGVGVTHHPLTVFSFPAYALFIILVRPAIWREWRTWLKMLAFAVLGLAVWLYFPIRSSMKPEFGPHGMNTISGFLDHVLARGITESIPFFGLVDQANRALVFWTLLRLQYSLTTLLLSAFGLIWLMVDPGSRQKGSIRPGLRPLGILMGLVLLANYLFVINLRQQDVMAYLLGIFLVIGLLSGVGLLGILDLIKNRIGLELKYVSLFLGALFLLGPILQIVRNTPVISLRDFDDADEYREAVFQWFEGSDEGAVLLNDWEHMTPLWYAQFVDKQLPDSGDVEPRLVSTDRPWLESVFDFLPEGPVYLSGYKPEIAAAGFRLRPRGPFYQVVEPGDTSLPPEITPIEDISAGELEILGYAFPEDNLQSGDFVSFVVAMRSPEGTADFYAPVLFLGQEPDQLTFEFTTDSHLITPLWQPGEVIVERFDFALPEDMAGGVYPVELVMRNLSKDQDSDPRIALDNLEIAEKERPATSDGLLANFRQRVGLLSARARVGLFQRRSAPWSDGLEVTAGDTVHLTLEWQSLAKSEDSYTVFVHLIDQANHPLTALDYTPLGGSAPTHLWIPKWLPGQRLLDPYQLEIPSDLAPGDYLIEVGLYEMTSGLRLHMSDQEGNLVGDRYILGPIRVVSDGGD
jgi:hypothetical protein